MSVCVFLAGSLPSEVLCVFRMSSPKVCWTQGYPGGPRVECHKSQNFPTFFSNQIFDRFFDGFWLPFELHVWMIFCVFCITFSSMKFVSILHRFWDGFWPHFRWFFDEFPVRAFTSHEASRSLFLNNSMVFCAQNQGFTLSEKHEFSWFSWSFSIPVLALTFYAPRLPADPLARSVCIRSFVCSLRALPAPCLGTTLGGTPPPEPHPQGPPYPPPRDPHPPTPSPPPPHPPPHPTTTPTPPHPPPTPHPHPPPASLSGRLLRVDGYSKWMVIPMAILRGPTVRWGWGLQRLMAAVPLSFTTRRAWDVGVVRERHPEVTQHLSDLRGSYFNSKFESDKQGSAQTQ